MKAAYFREKNVLEVIEKDKPVLMEGEALVKVTYAGICGTDLHVFRGGHATASYPRVPGHEFVGILDSYEGAIKKGISIGDTVVAQPFYSCGVCEPCITGKDNVCQELRILGVHTDGCFAEYVKVPLHKLYRLPDTIDPKLAAMTEPLAVAVHDVNRSGLKCGDTVLVSGGGPIGMLVAAVARFAGADVYISEVDEFRASFGKRMGFSVINPMKEKLSDAIKNIGTGKGFDIIYETSGAAAAIGQMTDAVKITGTIIVIGMAKSMNPVNTNAIYAKELNIFGVRIHSQQSFEGAIRILESGKLDAELREILDERVFTLDDTANAMEYCENDTKHFKTLIQI